MQLESYYINLDHRTDRKELMEKNWSGISKLNRIPATMFPEDQFGARGCFMSHQKALKLIAMDRSAEDLCIIMEDDIIPSKSFNDRLEIILSEIPNDWDLLMLGYSATERSKFSLVSNNLARAHEHVLSGTCYIVNPSFYDTMLNEYKDEQYEYNLDTMLMRLQKKHNFYMALPSLCYQYQSYSDNSKMVLDNVDYTKTYFKD